MAKSECTRVLLIDDHSMIADLLMAFLGTDSSFSVEVAGDLSTGLQKIREAQGYDVVLLDVVLPGLGGIDDVAKVVQSNPDGAVVLFSGSVSVAFIEKSVAVGGRGYIPKTMPLKALTSAIRLVAAGQTFIPRDLAATQAAPRQEGRPSLNQVELMILRSLSDGLANKEISFKYNLSESTVKMHVRSICKKLGARNRTHAVIIGRVDALL